MKLSLALSASAVSLVLIACGGIAIVDDAGAGGAGASGTGGMIVDTGVVTSSSSGFGPNSSASTGLPTDCFTACSMLYNCGLQNGPQLEPLCPAFTGTPQEQSNFVQVCSGTCANTPLLIELVDPNDCQETVKTVSGASPDFDQICHGFGGTPQ